MMKNNLKDTGNNQINKLARLPIGELCSILGTNIEKGLSSEKIKEKIDKYGLNEIGISKKTVVLVEFLKNFGNPVILILLVIAFISLFLGNTINALVVFTMVFLSVFLNFFQEHKANRAAQRLREKVSLVSIVIRNGKEEEIKTNQIVPGEILILNAGDLIPADARVIEAKDFFVNQSALTGESFPVEKTNQDFCEKDGNAIECQNLVYAGTNAVTGQAKAIVIATGNSTQFGNIAKDLNQQEEENSFTLGVKHFSYFILRIVLIFVIFIFAVNSLIKHDFVESLTFAIAVAVGLTPEFLPMIMTVTMAKGATAMVKKGVIVKKLTAIPTFGSMDILCTDKTGTLTQDKIKLVKHLNAEGKMDESVLKMAYLNSSFETSINNPLDEAIKNFKHLSVNGYSKVDEIPYDFERKRMSIIAKENNQQFMVTKGAPENIFDISDTYFKGNKVLKINKEIKEGLTDLYNKLSSDGFRVLAIATKRINEVKKEYSKKDETNLTFVGFTAFLDPVKPNVSEAIDKLEEIGIEIKVITGDNELIAQKACCEAGVKIKGILLGNQINRLTDYELGIKAEKTTVFARFSPAQKNRVIVALKLMKHVVGYMGDGINDAPSLKSADVGISVNNAVDVAKETADFILTHKSLAELSDGVIEGRKIFGNTMKYVMMGLSSNFGNMFSVLGAVLFLPFLPMLPIQILLNNFLYDLAQVTIPTDNVDPEYIKTPKIWDIKFIRRFMLIFGPISSLFDFITFGLMYYLFSHNPGAFQTGWFMESLATQTLVIHLIRTKKLPFIQSWPSITLLLSTVLVVIIGWIIPYTPLGNWVGFSPLPLYIVPILSLIVITYLIFVEFGKKLFYRVSYS